MFAKVGIALAVPFLLLALFVGASGVVVVDVKEGGADGHHFVIPVPLMLAQAALTFAPDDVKYLECEEFAPYQDIAERILLELEDNPDFVIAEVKEGDEHVLVEKIGNEIQVDVRDGDDDHVTCRFPIDGALKIVRSYRDGRFPSKAAIWGIKEAQRGTLVHVNDGEDVVKIRIL